MEKDLFHNNEKILLVDDDPRVRLVLEKLFIRLGYPYDTASDGEEALIKVKEGGCALGIYDIMMPKMDGIELLAHTVEHDPELPVIILTAVSKVEIVIETLKQGAFAYIRKPFTLDEIHREIRKGLKQRALYLENRNYRLNLERLVEEKTLELNKSRAELLLEKEKLENVLQNISAGLLVLNPKGEIIWRNNIIEEWFGDISNWPIKAKHQPSPLELINCKNCDIFSAGRSMTRKFSLDCIDGVRREFQWSCSPIRGTEGEVVLAVSLVQDITERSRMERELVHSERLASMGEIAAGWAHEINNPIGIILGMAQNILAETGDDGPFYEELKVIEDETLRTSRVVTSLLEFAHKPSLEMVEVDLFEVCRSSLSFLDYLLKKKNLNVEFEIADNLPVIRGDPDQLKQVMINILLNSIHALDYKGMIIIGIRREKVADSAGYLLCEISDNGEGVSPEDMENIFKPFFTRKGKKGTGLGLSIVRRIIENHGGEISIDSELGKGARVSIKLPV